MNFLSNPLVARLLWALPLLLLTISVLLVKAGAEQRMVAQSGALVEAQIDSLDIRERSEITHGRVFLRYTPPGASAPVARAVEMPLAFLKELEWEERESVTIRVARDTDQIVLDAHPRAQWILTFSFAGMALIGALGLAWMVGGWNRLLSKDGDPATRQR